MEFVEISRIIVPPNRIRRNFDADAMAQLADSIGAIGLLHPLLVRDDGVTLIAGERRLRFLSSVEGTRPIRFDGDDLPPGMVPVVRLSSSDAASVLEAELHENVRRQQLTWQEQAAATDALFKLRKVQSAAFTRSDLSEEINGRRSGGNHTDVSEDLLIASFLDDPEVAKAPTRKDALKIVERRLEQQHNVALAKRFGELSKGSVGVCYRGDMRVIAPTLTQLAACIIADPPYGITADTFANQDAIPHSYSDTVELSDELYHYIASIPTLPQSHAYIFCDARRFRSISSIFASAGWTTWPWPLIARHSPQIGLLPRPEHGPRRTYDAILYAIRGDRRVTGVFPDVIDAPHDSSTARGAHKSPELYADLIRRSCRPGDTVLDPCCGTGPLFPACRLTNTRGIGIELEEAAYTIAVERLKAC